MRLALIGALAALRAFARGFLGLAAPPPRDPEQARRALCERARDRTRCC